MEAKEIALFEKNLLSFLILISHSGDNQMLSDIFPTLFSLANFVRKVWKHKSQLERDRIDADFDRRQWALTEALFQCGIPRWICERNARAFLCLCPSFDLDSPKYKRLKGLLAYHQQVFRDAYTQIERSQGRNAADQWLQYIRDQDIVFARIAVFSDDVASKLLGGI